MKDSVLEAGLEGAQHLTAVAGSLGGALGVGASPGWRPTTARRTVRACVRADRRFLTTSHHIHSQPPICIRTRTPRSPAKPGPAGRLNNLAACARYTEKLRRELVAEVPSIFQDDPPTQQLMVGGST